MDLRKAFFALALLLITTQVHSADRPAWDVPRLDSILVDGRIAEWADRGFRVGLIENRYGGFPDSADFGADVKLGWDDRGLLVSANVRDDVAFEARGDDAIGSFDTMTLYATPDRSSLELFEVTIAPGIDPEAGGPRVQVKGLDSAGRPKEAYAPVWKVAASPNGYALEVLLPWTDFGTPPEGISAMGFQFRFMDADDADDRVIRTWRPLGFPYMDAHAHHRIRLAKAKTRDMLAVARGDYRRLRETVIQVDAANELAGAALTVLAGRRQIGKGRLEPAGGHASGKIRLPMPDRGKPYSTLSIQTDGRWLADVDLPDPDAWRARQIVVEPILFQQHVFSGKPFPSCEFKNPYFVEGLIGPHTIETTFFDRDYNVVEKALEPGRYGAVIKVIPKDGSRPFRRFRTLFRSPEELNWWEDRFEAALRMPQKTGIDPAVVALREREVNGFVNDRIWAGFKEDTRSGSWFAALYEAEVSDGSPGVSGDAWAVDRQWWVGLKRKLYGTGAKFPDPFVCPRPVDGPAGTVVRKGSLQEAGVTAAGVATIDSLLNAWVADSDEPFAVCLARHGVIFLHKAYGQFEGRSMRLTDKTWMASITKSMTGTLATMLVDQGLIRLDDPVSAYLPTFEEEGIAAPLTVRHLMTHTNGLWGWGGDQQHDFEERIGAYYPHLAFGEQYEYNGEGFALAGKVVEAVTGEAIPQFFKRHLLAPLGCDSTDVVGTAGDANSIPLDMAKLGQMLLNKGTYGNLRFFGEEAFQQMLPRPITEVVGHQTAHEYGLGLVWCKNDGLGEGTFCHGAASGATYRIDPEHDLVIVMTRDRHGINFSRYYPKFPGLLWRRWSE